MSTVTLDGGISKRRRVLWGAQSNETLVAATQETVSTIGPLPILSTYRELWEERRQRIPVHVDVTALASCKGLLVACTSLGQVFLWEDKGDTAKPNSNSLMAGSLLESTGRHWKVSSLPLKSIQIMDAKNNQDCIILVGGKKGMWTITLKDQTTIHQAQKWDNVNYDIHQVLVDRDRVFVLGELGKINVYGLAGKNFLYAIDLNGSFATTMALAPSDEGSLDQETQSMDLPRSLLIGTSDSKLLVWTASKVESICLHEPDMSKSESISTGCTGSLPFEIMVTAIKCTQDNWWMIAGSCRNKKSSHRNILATLHGSTRTLIAHKVLRETIHGIHCESQSPRLYTIANDGVVSVWDSPYRLELLQRLWSSPPSGRAVASVGSRRVAVAGIGPKIDLFENDCRVQSLVVDDTSTGSALGNNTNK